MNYIWKTLQKPSIAKAESVCLCDEQGLGGEDEGREEDRADYKEFCVSHWLISVRLESFEELGRNFKQKI